MHRLSLIFLAGALWSWSAVVQALDCNDKDAVAAEKDSCLSKYGLTTTTDVDQLENEIKTHLNTVCKDIDKYKSVLSCAKTVARNCLEATGGDADTIPEGEKVSEGLTYLCDHHEEIDMQCYKEKEVSLKLCLALKVKSEFPNITRDLDTTLVTCRTFEFSLDCMETLKGCSGKTHEIFETYTKYFIPPACGGAPILSSTSLLALSLAALVTFVFAPSHEQ